MIPAIGSFFSAALQRLLIMSHADHQNQLEEQAQRYESMGRPEIASLIREQSKALTLEKPMPTSNQVLAEFGAEDPAFFEASHSSGGLVLPDVGKRNKPRKQLGETTVEGSDS